MECLREGKSHGLCSVILLNQCNLKSRIREAYVVVGQPRIWAFPWAAYVVIGQPKLSMLCSFVGVIFLLGDDIDEVIGRKKLKYRIWEALIFFNWVGDWII